MQHLPGWRDHGDAALAQRGKADVPFGIHGQGVDVLHARQAADQPSAIGRIGPGPGQDVPELADVEGPQPPREGLRHIERLLIGRKTDSVGRPQREDGLADGAAIGARAHLAVVGEPEPAMPVEDQVVGPLQWSAAALRVQAFDLARGEVHGLYAPA